MISTFISIIAKGVYFKKMKRVWYCLLFVFLILNAAAAEEITLSTPNFTDALTKATLWDSDGNIISPDKTGETTIRFYDESGDNELSVSDVALIEFAECDESKALTDINKEDIAKFTGLTSLSLNNCTELTTLDLSGNETIEILDISNLGKLTTVTASSMKSLKAVGIARINLANSSSILDLLGGSGNTGESTPAIASLSSNILAALTELDLSNNPMLTSVGYVLTQEKSSGLGLGSLFGGSNTSGDNSGSNSPQVTKYGYKIKTVFTTLNKDTTFLKEDQSYSEEPPSKSSNFLEEFLTGTNGNVLGTYSDETVNLLPKLTNFKLTSSGTDSLSYISEIDIEGLTTITTADFDGMTKLKKISLPSGKTLTALNLNGDTALESLELSNTEGFIFPAGFNTLTGLLNFRMYGRNIDSIDVTPFTKLVTLNLTSNMLISLDVTKNPELETLYIGNNMVRELDLSSQTKLRSIDIANNSLVKIDLSRNINMLVHQNDLGTPVRLSNQKRDLEAEGVTISKIFDFRKIYPQMTPVERASIVWDSIAGNGQKTASFDVDTGTVEFAYYPTVITYEYKSGINYSNTTTPLCMAVELRWDGVTDDELDDLRENDPDSDSSEDNVYGAGGSSGGCNSGIFSIIALGLAGVIALKKK